MTEVEFVDAMTRIRKLETDIAELQRRLCEETTHIAHHLVDAIRTK